MQNFVVSHSGTPLSVPAAVAFGGSGATFPSSHPFAIESYFTATPVPVGDSAFAWVAQSFDPYSLSRIDRMVSSAGNIAIPPEGAYLYFFRTELPAGTDPNAIDWAMLGTGVNTQIQPIFSTGSYKTLSWRDCVPMSFLDSTAGVGNAVYYGVVLRFVGLAAAGAMSGLISCRDVLVDRAVLQPLK